MPPLEEFAVDGGELAWKKEYMNCALAYRPLIRKILEHIRDTPAEPVLFHCTGTSPSLELCSVLTPWKLAVIAQV